MNVLIRPETPADREGIADVNRLAFGQPDEARLVEELRTGGFVRVSLLAEVNSRILGHILFSDLPIVSEHRTTAALSLAPLAVLPEYQRQGIGQSLVKAGLATCRKLGHRIVIVLGDPQYYARFGFSPKLAEPLESPFAGGSFMALELVSGSLSNVAGRVTYPRPFGVFL